jgi:recombinational DNA repair protein RecR
MTICYTLVMSVLGKGNIMCCADCACLVEHQPCEACENYEYRPVQRVYKN